MENTEMCPDCGCGNNTGSQASWHMFGELILATKFWPRETGAPSSGLFLGSLIKHRASRLGTGIGTWSSPPVGQHVAVSFYLKLDTLESLTKIR